MSDNFKAPCKSDLSRRKFGAPPEPKNNALPTKRNNENSAEKGKIKRGKNRVHRQTHRQQNVPHTPTFRFVSFVFARVDVSRRSKCIHDEMAALASIEVGLSR
jgi:hypothetical protein